MNYCPCCSNLLLQHIRQSEIYWFCRSCWQEMPVFTQGLSCSLTERILSKSSIVIQQPKRLYKYNYLREKYSIQG
ncbi:hypothetical protein Anacy_4205 [Anabaena cylindrica PCC 7122]|uniref:Uncharacterized protein n=1 Tax=Anabaena cylindrica (strain ATCC 27899 / PCC 7122) TaxID=272123 RepID=K9ZK36_ANACC|nr:hypothetical protein Anacy_4205 [Anabaena cylindrica PCC 7122]BAY03385.1 hypothetical protein NIES19_26380 [Anabaena cylindrica PCC 7122]